MRKMSALYNSIVGRTRFNPLAVTVDGMQVMIGTVDHFDGDPFLSMTFSDVIFPGIGHYPAIVICTGDLENLLDMTNNISAVGGILSFAIAHEFGHIKQWKTFPDTCKPGQLSTELDPELIADCYAIRMNGIRKDVYHLYINMFLETINSRVNRSRKISWLNRKITTLYNRHLLYKRMRLVDQRVAFGTNGTIHKNEDPSYKIAKEILGTIIDRNEGRWTDD